jgi:hypothetical protein
MARVLLFRVGIANPVIVLIFSMCAALVPLISLLPIIDLVNIAVMDLNGPVSRPFVSGQFFCERDTAVPSAFTKTADDKLNYTIVRTFGVIFLPLFGDLGRGISVSLRAHLIVCKPPI